MHRSCTRRPRALCSPKYKRKVQEESMGVSSSKALCRQGYHDISQGRGVVAVYGFTPEEEEEEEDVVFTRRRQSTMAARPQNPVDSLHPDTDRGLVVSFERVRGEVECT